MHEKKVIYRGHDLDEAYKLLLNKLGVSVEEREVEFVDGREPLKDIEKEWRAAREE